MRHWCSGSTRASKTLGLGSIPRWRANFLILKYNMLPAVCVLLYFIISYLSYILCLFIFHNKDDNLDRTTAMIMPPLFILWPIIMPAILVRFLYEQYISMLEDKAEKIVDKFDDSEEQVTVKEAKLLLKAHKKGILQIDKKYIKKAEDIITEQAVERMLK